MILVDTSVWIDHFRNANEQLSELLYQGKVVTHDLIIGELACGNLKNRQEILSYMQALPKTINPTHEEVLIFIENYKLYGIRDKRIISFFLYNNMGFYLNASKCKSQDLI